MKYLSHKAIIYKIQSKRILYHNVKITCTIHPLKRFKKEWMVVSKNQELLRPSKFIFISYYLDTPSK